MNSHSSSEAASSIEISDPATAFAAAVSLWKTWHKDETDGEEFSLSDAHNGREEFMRLAVFVDGCFWHGCPKHGTQPKGNAKFWRDKLAQNKARDRRVNRALRRAGWRVLRIWGHELAVRNRKRLLARLLRALRPA